MKQNPLVISYPMVGTNIATLVKTIVEATKEGYEPVLSQCHNYFGTVTVTMVKKEGEEVEQSVGESVGTGNSKASDKTGGEEDRKEQATDGGSGELQRAGDSDTNDGSEQPEAGSGDSEGDTGVSTGTSGGTGEEAPKVKATRKTTKTK